MSAGFEVVAVSALFGFLVSFGAGFAGLVSCCRHPFVTVSMRLRPKRYGFVDSCWLFLNPDVLCGYL